jgi:membrane protein required for colicin V production
MSFFDLAAGLALIVSALIGWVRGGAREAAGMVALAIAAIVAFAALRFTGPIARHAIHTAWLANVAAVMVVFVTLYALLRVLAASLSRGLYRNVALGALDRTVGAGFGLSRALVFLGLLNLTLNAVMPAERMPTWISGAKLYPVSDVSADALKRLAPKGEALAAHLAPAVSHALTDSTDSGQNAGASDASDQSLKVEVEKRQ